MRIAFVSTLALALTLTLFVGQATFAAEAAKNNTAKSTWMTDFDAALKLSAKSGKPILINFTGSDWCGWCVKLRGEVFSKDTFKTWAKENLILVVADFPKRKPQTNEQRTKNRKLAQQYGVRGFPTILLLDTKGQAVQKTGYRPGGAQAWIDHIKENVSKNKKAS